MNSSLSILGVSVIAGALCCLPRTASAQGYPQAGTRQPDQTQSNNQNTSPLSASDKTFVDKAIQGGKAEVELGQLAMQRATNPDVKAFAQRMVHDHTQANEKLGQIADREGISVPKKVSTKDAELKARLENLHGEAFDKAYMENMVQDHKKDIAAFQHQSANGQNSSVRQFATDTLPILQSHLQQAESVASKVNASTSARTTY